MMKKALSLSLAILLLFGTLVPAFAENTAPATITPQRSGSVPMVLLMGDGESIYDENGKRIDSFVETLSKMLSDDDSEESAEEGEGDTGDSARNVLKGFAEAMNRRHTPKRTKLPAKRLTLPLRLIIPNE